MADGQVVFEISADGKRAMASINDITNAIEKAGKQWDRSVDSSADNMQKSFSKAFDIERLKNFGIEMGKALWNLAKESRDAASDLREVQNVVDVTFGDSAGQINAWAQTAIKQFGLTETKAKQFTSTLGAMMKSAGLAGPEIVTMSEDLAGLAADMSSFYNLDFDTAFQKIRSGISGETEPLKQLGINMSVANLNAFALEKGLSKTFEKMSQGEQISLRYQYLMKATADAQGDFARTSDGYANSLRLLEANIESIKTKLGTFLIPAFESATGFLNAFIEELTPTEKRTVLDDFAEIDLKTEEKLSQIQKTAAEANGLAEVLKGLAETDAGAAMKSIAEGANVLNANSPHTWESLLGALKQVNGLSNVFNNTNAGKNVEELAQALSGNSPDVDKAAAWKTFLNALQENSGALATLTGKSAEKTAAWLASIADAANKIEPSDAEAWNKLLTNFVGGLPGLADTEGGKAFFDAMTANFLAMGTESEQAKAGLAALGMNTDQIKDKQAQWLEVCKRLVQTIPGLSSVINTETGEITGGIAAVQEYVSAYEKGQQQIAKLKMIQAKRDALNKAAQEYYDAQIERSIQEDLLQYYKEQVNKYGMGLSSSDQKTREEAGEGFRLYNGLVDETTAKIEALKAKEEELAGPIAKATKELDDQEAAVKANGVALEDTSEAAKETAQAMTDIELAASKSADGQAEALKRVKTAVENAKDAYKAMAEYIEKTRSGIESTVNGMFGVFSKVETPMQKAINNTKNLTAELNKGTITQEEYNKKISGNSDNYMTSSKIIDGLKSQIDYMKDYQDMLAKAKAAGLSEDLAAALSDGSTQSYDYLKALTAKGADIKQINELYSQVQTQKSGFVDALTEQKLKADEVFDAIVAKAQEATAGLDQSGAAETALSNTIQGMVQGIENKIPDLRSQVEEVGKLLNTLSEYGVSFDGLNLGTIGGENGINLNFSGGDRGNPNVSINSQEIGLDRVPFDGYLAALHEGESILNAEEARVWRNMKYGPSLAGNQFDYGAMGSAIGANMPNFNGMEVRWNGQVLGRVIAAQQADSLRTMERSGWRG